MILRRTYYPNKTLGDLTLFDGNKTLIMLKTLELPWKQNKKFISCIPEGQYDVIYPYSGTRFKNVFWIDKVPNRSGILIHIGNYTSQIEGCILPGIIHDDINGDGVKDVKHSGVAMEALRFYVGDIKKLTITIYEDKPSIILRK